ncbi:MAG TPA: LysM peptidoglycan-binding domain-containing protein [Cytophagaceae bacterium]
MIKRIFVTTILLTVTALAFAGVKDSIGVTKVNDKLHIRYLVSPGETIYGISTRYGVPVSDLLEINPELENGLKVGQVINIPYNREFLEKSKKSDKAIYHKVQPGETLYGISKKYNIPLNDLLKLNNMELKAGQEIIIGYKESSTESKVTITDNKTSTNTETQENTAEKNEPQKTQESEVVVKENTEVKENKVVDNEIKEVKEAKVVAETKEETVVSDVAIPEAETVYHYDPTKKQVLIIPFDPYLYFSDADDEIAAKSNMNRTKVRQVFRRRLNALLDAPGYETIHLLGGKAKDSLSDINKVYSSVTYNYQEIIDNPYANERLRQGGAQEIEVGKSNKSWLDKQKAKITGLNESKYNIPKDHGKYFGVLIKDPEFFNYFNRKYSIDYYIFVSQFEVKTNYENCLDRAALNYERTFTTHYSIFDASGKQIAGNKFKTHYNSNSNYIYQIVSDNIPKIAERILLELPPPTE